ncbi:acyltransferase family protein [Microlunatus elymi]|uniref:acyltransferase family protein n=1 Tax=Microlunatus elymi TaxID=2596828 RepID=UPI00224A7FBE|nr:acyltransferase family protein [Microlunatus elymi]
MIHEPAGGFIGVDVFFVISGFLITSLLVREHAKTGRISIKAFYQRRARRILPAGLLVLLVTAVSARFLLLSSRYTEAIHDVGWASVFLANVHFASVGTDYFQADRPPSPVQHYWSLSVEEQFYLVWPLALIVLLALTSRLVRHRQRGLVIITVIINVSLFALAGYLTWTDRSAAYFVTPARAWELGVGACIALLMMNRTVPSALSRVLLPAGLAAIACAAVLVHDGPGFPAPLGALPVLGSAAIIVAGGAARLPASALVLTNPVCRYIGRASYSLYLVHFPVIVLLGAVTTSQSIADYAVAVLAITAAGVACHEFVENPLRTFDYGAMVRGLRPSTFGTAPRRAGRRRLRPVSVAVVAAVVGALVCWSLRPYAPVRVFAEAPSKAPSAGDVPYGQVTPPAAWSRQIVAALNSHAMPKLNPPQARLADDKVPEWNTCGNVGPAQLTRCTFPATKHGKIKKLVVIGDSIAITWLPAIRGLQGSGFSIYALTFGQCPAPKVSVQPQVGGRADFTKACDDHRSWALAQLRSIKPDVVVLASAYSTVERLNSGQVGDAAVAQWAHGTEQMVSTITRAGVDHVVLLASPPQGSSMQSCTPADGDPSHCIATVSAEWRVVADAERRVMKDQGQTYLDTHLFFCSADGYCPPFVGTNTPLIDGIHLADNYSRRLAPIVDPLIMKAVGR